MKWGCAIQNPLPELPPEVEINMTETRTCKEKSAISPQRATRSTSCLVLR